MTAAARDPMLAQIHCAKRDLGLDEDTYRAMLGRVTGKTSAGAMSGPERAAVLEECRRLGWAPAGRAPGKRFKREERADLRLIFVLWGMLGRAGHVTPGRRALNAFVGNPKFAAKWGEAATDVRFLAPARAHDVIEALKSLVARHGVEEYRR